MWRVMLIAVVACGCGSSKTTVSERLAVGWVGTFHYLIGPSGCEPGLANEPLFVPAGSGWRAARAGSTTVPCQGGDVEVTIAAPAMLSIDAPITAGVQERFTALVHAKDSRGRELSIGMGEVTWSFGGVIEGRATGCHGDMDIVCAGIEALVPESALTHAIATAPGAGTITASFGGLRTARVVGVR